jgi:hypothetical protein
MKWHDTEYYKKQNESLSNLIDKYSLKLKLDDLGFGVFIYYKEKELGYYYHGLRLDFNSTVKFGGIRVKHGSYESMCNQISQIIDKFERKVAKS